jgi:pterin-4a-carbinolamine dehydratase
MKIFLSQSQDKKKNPLDYSDKVKFIKSMFPEYASDVVEDSSLNTVVKVASHLYDLGYRSATFVAGSDRLEDMKKLLEAYNGVEGKAHGFYDFEVLDFKSSGEREDGAEGVAGVSASGARAAAANSDLDAFREATGAGELSQKLYDAVRKGMGINEGVSEGKFRKVDIEDKVIDNDKLNDLKSKYLPDWEMLDHRILQAKYVAKDHRHALEFVSFVNKLSEKMDHFAEVTQDVAEITVKTTTFDVKGLTILDFRLALKVDKYADANDIEQVRMQGNFGMHESNYGRYYSPSEKITKWKKSETDTDIRTFQGHQMKFAKGGLMIYKGGDLVFKREGDFSNPTNNQIVTAKMAVSRLLKKG